ncbi:DUF305 domain-containing protein [Flaviaesturariibacter amylovorans]|uniref:DUF305 domain-containing protein n=1 Tax=Flaviaesturariibacter amylovorans TaxID=1084520 RepID=A0ABP8HLE7_9BACT
MKRIFVLGASVVWLAACSGNDNQTATTETTTETATHQDTSGASSNTAATPTSGADFQGVMSKMMSDMHGMTMTQDQDHDFAMMMKEHHEGAIEMSNIELSSGSNAELKQVAQKIIDDSRKDITELDAFMKNHQPNGKSDFAQKSMEQMMKGSSMNMNHGGSVDQQFAMMMSMHHQQGIDMARLYLKSARSAETKKVANNTIQANTEDNKKLAKFQNGNSGTDMPGHNMNGMSGHDSMSH